MNLRQAEINELDLFPDIVEIWESCSPHNELSV
jgi:hypothetical protein